MNISIRKMRAFLAIVEEQNFTRAARKQSISQPAITIIINQIEDELQKRLFVRQGKSRTADLTPEGKAVAETFARVVANFDIEIDRLTHSNANRQEEKTFLIQASLADEIDPEWFDAMLRMLDAGRLVIRETSREEIIQSVYERKTSLALLDGKVDQERADYVTISDYSIVLAIPPESRRIRQTDGMIMVGDIPDGSYVLQGFATEVSRGLKSLSRNTGHDMSRFDQVSGMTTLDRLMERDPRPVILPSMLADRLRETADCRIFEIGPNAIQCLVGLVAPWGYMSQYKLERIRRFNCFAQSATLSARAG